jgi:hypothetical protein
LPCNEREIIYGEMDEAAPDGLMKSLPNSSQVVEGVNSPLGSVHPVPFLDLLFASVGLELQSCGHLRGVRKGPVCNPHLHLTNQVPEAVLPKHLCCRSTNSDPLCSVRSRPSSVNTTAVRSRAPWSNRVLASAAARSAAFSWSVLASTGVKKALADWKPAGAFSFGLWRTMNSVAIGTKVVSTNGQKIVSKMCMIPQFYN